MNQENLFVEYKKFFESENLSENLEPNTNKPSIFGYSPFALQDAIGEKNVKKIWLEYEKIRFAGVEADELIHKMISKVRDMVAINLGAGKEDLGIKDYPYSKSKKDLKNWKKEELEDFYENLIGAFHRSRMGVRPNDYSIGLNDDLDLAIEKIILSLNI